MKKKIQSGLYKHHSGLVVFLLGVARHSETEEKLIAYIPLGVQKGPRITVRPYDMFFEEIDDNGVRRKRFTYIGSEMPEELAQKYSPLSK